MTDKQFAEQGNARLRELYSALWPRAADVLRYADFSLPFLGAFTDGYVASRQRLLVVGQQTRGWSHLGQGGWGEHGANPELIPTLMEFYSSYLSGPAKKRGWFLGAAKTFQGALNPAGPEYGFAWRNLFIVDEAGRKPREQHHAAIRSITPLQEEIDILRPEVVVFMTGHIYDFTLKHYFGPSSLERYDSQLNPDHLLRVRLPWKDMLGLRIPHPRVPQTHHMVDKVAALLRAR
jgi:hypothetical protein